MHFSLHTMQPHKWLNVGLPRCIAMKGKHFRRLTKWSIFFCQGTNKNLFLIIFRIIGTFSKNCSGESLNLEFPAGTRNLLTKQIIVTVVRLPLSTRVVKAKRSRWKQIRAWTRVFTWRGSFYWLNKPFDRLILLFLPAVKSIVCFQKWQQPSQFYRNWAQIWCSGRNMVLFDG